MIKRLPYLFFLGVLFLFSMSPERVMAAEKPLEIVATQALFADLVKQVGQDKVDVRAIASPKFNIHFIQPRPSDVRDVTQADLYVNAGLDLEAWSDPLLEAVGRPQLFRRGERNLDLSSGIRLLKVPDHPVTRAEGDIHLFGNPHFQMNPENARIMVRVISEKLKEIDPVNASYYEENAKVFLGRLDRKIAEWKSLCAHCVGKEIISYHDDIVYFADFLGLKADQELEPKPGIPPTPKHFQFLEDYVKEHQVKAIVLPTYFSRSTAEKLAKRIGAKVATICQNVGEAPGTDDFFSFFDYNFKQISEALQ
jgi:ABC-type Zn uptake system ZnuABC Zn-binding protein ZnuA